jgi:hypothetical protein
MENINYEAIFGILSEINRKLDTMQASSKTLENQTDNSYISEKEMEIIAEKYANALGKYITVRHKEQTEHHAKIFLEIQDIKKQLETIPSTKNISLEPILKSLPRPKKVTICGFEFLRSSVIIFALILILFCSLAMNVKHRKDFMALKTKYIQTQIDDYKK